MSITTYDAVIIGAGQGGSLAKHLALHGRRTALIERYQLGGSCINWGCTPTKLMVTAARTAHVVRRAKEFGIHATLNKVDFHAIREQKRALVEEFRGDYKDSISGIDNLDIIWGEASFEDAKTLCITQENGKQQKIRADIIVIATGTHAATDAVYGLENCDYLTAESIMELDTVPEHLTVLGGGYIGLEFAQMFRRFGAKVTIVQRGPQILSREDKDVADAITRILKNEGIEILLNCQPEHVKKEQEMVKTSFQYESQFTEITGSHLLLAIGQVPNTKELHLEKAGVETDEKTFVRVNPALETNVPGIYAMGDVKGGPGFTHVAYDDTRILRDNLVHGAHRTTEGRIIPSVVFIDPQLGRIGMTEKEARAKNIPIRIATLTPAQTARGIETKETQGLLKAIVHASTNEILGAAILAFEGGEIMGTLQMAIQAKMPYTALRDGIFAHPTMVEAFNLLFLTMDK